MTLTLRSSTSFHNHKNVKIPQNVDDFSKTICFVGIRPFNKIRSFQSIQAVNLTHESISSTLETTGTNQMWEEKLHLLSSPSSHHGSDAASVPVYVMLPLDTVSVEGNLNKPRAMNASLMALKNAGVEGVMVDAWWGLVEKDGPMKYNWEGYAELINMVQKHGLKLQVVMSFHQCGGNVGDSCSIPLPPWVLEEISKNPDLVYTDRSGRRNPEYISLGCDSLPVLRGRIKASLPFQISSTFC